MKHVATFHVPAEPTEEQLRATWARIRRASWPATFEEAMADSVLKRLLRINAMHPPPQHTRPARLAFTTGGTPGFLEPKHPDQRFQAVKVADPASRALPGMAPARIDRKRAAAGERDDD